MPITFLILIPTAWILILILAVAACRMAARGDAMLRPSPWTENAATQPVGLEQTSSEITLRDASKHGRIRRPGGHRARVTHSDSQTVVQLRAFHSRP